MKPNIYIKGEILGGFSLATNKKGEPYLRGSWGSRKVNVIRNYSRSSAEDPEYLLVEFKPDPDFVPKTQSSLFDEVPLRRGRKKATKGPKLSDFFDEN